MPLNSLGMVPASGDIFNELTALTRRAYVPKIVVQLYFASPTLYLLMGGAQRCAGGVNQITIPVQGSSMVQGTWAGYLGTFNKPQVLPGVQAAQFGCAYYVVPVPLVLGESLLQSTEAIVPILDARINDVIAVTNQQMGEAVFLDNTQNPLMPNSFVDAFDDATNIVSYGGINRNGAGNSFWQGNYFSATGAILTRASIARYILRVTDLAGGEAPNAVIMSPPDFSALNTNFMSIDNNFINPGGKYDEDTDVRASFPNLEINGVPIFCDHWCPAGEIYMINTKYTAMYASEDANFLMSDFHSLVPNMQIGHVAAMIHGYNIVTAKPVSGARLVGVTGAEW